MISDSDTESIVSNVADVHLDQALEAYLADDRITNDGWVTGATFPCE
jgi:hypothetical protein